MSFRERCYEILKKVPKGKVTTYKKIARALNSKAYRAVGTAMNKNPYSFIDGGKVPCHRVINSDGRVGKFAERLCENQSAKRNVKSRAGSGVCGQKKKIEILEKEGIEIQRDRINLKRYLYKFA